MNNLNIPYFFTKDLDTHKEKLSEAFTPIFDKLSSEIDVSILEGITFASNNTYEEALNCIDRGFKISNRIQPSPGGSAMTLHVNRNNNLTAHIVFNINMFDKDLLNPLNLGPQAITTIAHEMAHVEIMKDLHQYEQGMCFVKPFYSIKEGKGFELSKLCMEEYIACRKSYQYDDNLAIFNSHQKFLIDFLTNYNNYKTGLLDAFEKNELNELDYIYYSYSLYGQIIKSFSYYLGSMPNGTEVDEFIKNSVLKIYFDKLKICLNESFSDYPLWKNVHPFKNIQILLEEILEKETSIYFYKNLMGEDIYKITV